MITPPPPAFDERLTELGVAFDSGDIECLGQYLTLLDETNQKFNLTRIVDPDDAWMRHIGDSLTLLPILVSLEAKRVIDVGSGGGLPGIPLAISMPDVSFTLLEATGKKARFLEETVAALELDNVTVIQERAETLAHDRDEHREMYDVAMARAVGQLPVLLELTLPFVRRSGHLLAIKGEQAETEIENAETALATLGGVVVDKHRTATGTIVSVEKTMKTPRTYPRRPGEPKRMPLGWIPA